MRRFGALLLAAALLGAGRAGAAEAPDTLRVPVRVSPAVARVGERVHVRVAVPLGTAGGRLEGPPAPSSAGDLDLITSQAVAAGKDSAAWELEVAFFRPGDVTLRDLPFRLETPAGALPVQAAPFLVSVVSTLPDTLKEAGLPPIKPPVSYPLRWRWGRMAFALGVVAAVAAALWMWRRRRRAVVPALRYVPPVDPEREALLALSGLEAEALAARGLVKEHYARLSLILRTYIERRLEVPAVESTTLEIRGALDQRATLPGEDRTSVFDLFEEADLVKFARLRQGPEAAATALGRGREWVERTGALRRPAPPEGKAS